SVKIGWSLAAIPIYLDTGTEAGATGVGVAAGVAVGVALASTKGNAATPAATVPSAPATSDATTAGARPHPLTTSAAPRRYAGNDFSTLASVARSTRGVKCGR